MGLKPVNCGCGGEAIVDQTDGYDEYQVYCPKCFMQSGTFNTETEAIQAWNKAMSGSAEEKLKAFWDGMSAEMKEERTAKVKHLERRSETSMTWVGVCTKCGSYTMHEMNYCFHCGCRLEWE